MTNTNNLYKRQADIITPRDINFPITIIGAGGIGSWTTFALAKMGAGNITIIDFDDIEEHNLPSQFYGFQDVGKSKVDALQIIVRTFTDTVPVPFNGTFEEYVASSLPFGRVVICAVDSLETRKKIWEVMKPMLGMVDLYIDARMGGDQIRILCVSPYNADSITKYQKNMESTQLADPTPCGERAVGYGTGMVSNMIASIVKRYAKREEIDFDYMFSCANFDRA